MQIFYDVVAIVGDVTQTAADVKALNYAGVITLSAATWASIQQLIADAKAGDASIIASLKVLGVTI